MHVMPNLWNRIIFSTTEDLMTSMYFINPEKLSATKSMGGKYHCILQMGKLEKREGTEFAKTTSISAIRTRVSQLQMNQKNLAPTWVTVTYNHLKSLSVPGWQHRYPQALRTMFRFCCDDPHIPPVTSLVLPSCQRILHPKISSGRRVCDFFQSKWGWLAKPVNLASLTYFDWSRLGCARESSGVEKQ